MFFVRSRMRLSQGERSFFILYLAFATIGACFALEIVMRLEERGEAFSALDVRTLWILISGGIGGLAGLLATYDRWLGFPGLSGSLRAVFGALILTLASSVFGGTLVLPYYGTMFAPFQVVIVMISEPILAVVWATIIGCAHYLIALWRVERNSIFAADAVTQ